MRGCGRRHEQSYMYRVPQKIVSNGWICPQCNHDLVNENYYETDPEQIRQSPDTGKLKGGKTVAKKEK